MADIKNPVFLAKVRKRFNREYINFSIGDLVRTDADTIGEYQGLSTNYSPGKLTILLYKSNKDVTKNEINKLPSSFKVEGKNIPVEYQLLDKPEIGSPQKN